MNCDDLSLLCHAYDQMYVYMIASSIKIIKKHNVFAVYRFKSARIVSCSIHSAIGKSNALKSHFKSVCTEESLLTMQTIDSYTYVPSMPDISIS